MSALVWVINVFNPAADFAFVSLLQVSKQRSLKANKDDYHEWSINEGLKPHPNVVQIIGLCPSFSHVDFPNAGTTAIVLPLQENGSLETFMKRGARRCVPFGKYQTQ